MIDVVGLTARGGPDLSEEARELIASAELVVGSPRQLSLVQAATTAPLPSPLRDGLRRLAQRHERLVVLASGDPLLSGIGSTLIDVLGADRVRIHPAVSSIALARARMGWSAESCGTVSVVGRSLDLIRRELAPGRRLIVLSSDAETPAAVAGLLESTGYGGTRLTVLGDLGAPEESRRDGPARDWSGPSPALNVVALECVADPGALLVGRAPGLPDEAYEHDGQLTKRDVRAAVLARLAPRPGELLWDLGAGAGSIAIEWCRADPTCRAVAVERDPERARRIRRNAASLGVPSAVRVEIGAWGDRLDTLGAAGSGAGPDAIVVGGGCTAGSLDACWPRLSEGGRLVATAVTVETEAALLEAARTYGGEVVRVGVETLLPLGAFRGWQPARPVVIWSARR